MGEGGGGVWRCKWGEELGGGNCAGVCVSDGGWGGGGGGERVGVKMSETLQALFVFLIRRGVRVRVKVLRTPALDPPIAHYS